MELSWAHVWCIWVKIRWTYLWGQRGYNINTAVLISVFGIGIAITNVDVLSCLQMLKKLMDRHFKFWHMQHMAAENFNVWPNITMIKWTEVVFLVACFQIRGSTHFPFFLLMISIHILWICIHMNKKNLIYICTCCELMPTTDQQVVMFYHSSLKTCQFKHGKP